MSRAAAVRTALACVAASALTVAPAIGFSHARVANAASLSPTGSPSTSPSAAAPTTSKAAPTGRIERQAGKTGELQVTFSAIGLAAGQSIDPTSVRVFLDTTPVSAKATPIGAQETGAAPVVTRTAVLVVDVSGSMAGAALDGAKTAAKAFLSAVPPDVKVGLVVVSTTATLGAAPTTDRAEPAARIGALTATGDTALYDGTLLAEQTVGTAGSRTIVLLTDGHDEGSKTSLAQAVAAAHDSGAVLDAVSLGTSQAQLAPLQQLTAAAGGRLLATDQIGDFAPAFQQAAQDIATQVLVTAQIPAAFAGKSVTVSVTATAGGTTITDSAAFKLASFASSASQAAAPPSGPHPVAVYLAPLGSRSWLILGVAAIFVGLLGLLGALLFKASLADARETRMRRRLSFYTLSGRGSPTEAQQTALGDNSVARSAVQLAGRLVVTRELEAKLGRRLDAAGVPLKAAEWIVVQSATVFGLGILFFLLSNGSPVAAALGLLIGLGAPIGYLVIKEGRRSAAFLEQLPETLQLIAGSLSVGHSIPQAMDAVIREELQPMSVEFNRALIETRLGMPVEDALEGISTRMDSQDFAWIVMAIRIQREVGGNLAEILTTVAATIRERERIRRQVRGLSAEGRLSAWILGGLPPAFATYLILVRPSYIRPLFTDPLGVVMLVLMLALMGAGAFWLSRIVKVEV